MSGEASRLQGAKAEELALAYLLEQESFQVLAQNFRCRMGEIDLVLASKPTRSEPEPGLIFVEMRYRKNDSFGSAAQSVTYAKRKKISLAARFFIAKHSPKYDDFRCRFDVMAMSGPPDNPEYQWLQNAFNLC